jgi:O-antigen ligase
VAGPAANAYRTIRGPTATHIIVPTPAKLTGPRAVPAIAAAAVPSLLAFNVPPSPTFLNQALALVLWGGFLLVTVDRQRGVAAAWALHVALCGVALGVCLSWGPGLLPASLALSALALLGATLSLVSGGASTRGARTHDSVLVAFCAGWVVAGALNVGLSVIQVFAPGLPDGDWIARSGLPGRAVGNLRQPNHLSSLLLWSSIALVPLLEAGRLRLRTAALLLAAFMFAVVLTASRTGLVSVLLLAAWGLMDRQLSRPTRRLLMAAVLLYVFAWGGMWLWAHASDHAFGGEARLTASDISSSRFGIWDNTLALIRAHPWTGVGWGNFNLAWTLTPFPGRPTAFFDHTHNLPLQLLVELGLPLGGLVLGLLGWALWQAWRRSRTDVGARTAAMFVVMIGVHSLLEYPLWYAYFLLPAAWAWGYALGVPPAPGHAPPAKSMWAPLAGGVLVLGALWAVADYWRVVRIFEAGPGAPPLAERIADGRRSVLFGHHADYAAATTGMPQPDGLAVFDRPVHYLLDTRLMVAWARALHEAGREEEARQLAQRLREFGAQRAEDFFAPCADPASAAQSFACQPPARSVDWRAYLSR